MSFSSAYADDSCAAYPLEDGMSAEQTPQGPKILSTASISVDFDDQGVVLDALREAELNAKAAISRFYNEEICIQLFRKKSKIKIVF